MGIKGSVTSAVSSTSVTMPETGLTLVGVGCQKNTIGGYLQILINNAADTALLPFSTQRGVTTLDVPVNQALPYGMWLTDMKLGLKLNYTGTGLTSGTFFFYYGTPFDLPMATHMTIDKFAGVEQDVTTSVAGAFTFPGGTVHLTGLCYEAGYNTAETNINTDFTWNSSSGRVMDLNVANKDPLAIIPIEGIDAAQSLTVTAAFDGTHVATGRLILYYTRPGLKA